MHAFNTAGDAAVAISLAGTLFFQVPSGEARGQVALFLGLTMLPFAIVAPLIGPFLDRFSHGRRWAIGSTMAARGRPGADARVGRQQRVHLVVPDWPSAAWSRPRRTASRGRPPYPVCSRRTSPSSRPTAGSPSPASSAPPCRPPSPSLASLAGAEWSLRYAFVLFVVATIWAIRLPKQVDSDAGEDRALLLPGDDQPPPRRGKARMRIPASVSFALRANCGPRWLSGFLTMFMAFLLRENPIEGWSPQVLLGIVIGAAGLGNVLGIALASVLRRINPALTVVLALLADALIVLLAAVFYGVVSLVLVGLTAGLSQSLAKLSLDSTIQRDVPERVRTSAFARSDTTLQLAWVLGGFVGIVMPLSPCSGWRWPAPALRGGRSWCWPARRGAAVPPSPRRVRRPSAPPRLPRPSPARPAARRERRREGPQPSSSSASARSSLATGPAAVRSGCRPWR